jgi:hypothetical protein
LINICGESVVGKSLRCIEVLLQCGANPNLKNDVGLLLSAYLLNPGLLGCTHWFRFFSQQNRTPLDELDTDPSIVKV